MTPTPPRPLGPLPSSLILRPLISLQVTWGGTLFDARDLSFDLAARGGGIAASMMTYASFRRATAGVAVRPPLPAPTELRGLPSALASRPLLLAHGDLPSALLKGLPHALLSLLSPCVGGPPATSIEGLPLRPASSSGVVDVQGRIMGLASSEGPVPRGGESEALRRLDVRPNRASCKILQVGRNWQF